MTSTATIEKLAQEDFKSLQAWLLARGSVALGDSQLQAAEKRLYPLLWKHKVATFHELCAFLQRSTMAALHADVIEALTSNSTWFFRDPACFEYLRAHVLPQLIEARSASRELRVWSAGCSSGQEAYSLAMLLAAMPELDGWKVTLLASDLSQRQVDRARQGIYTRDEVSQGLPSALMLQHFQQDGIVWTARPALKERIQFQALRLDQSWPEMPGFDLIVMRNVLPTLEAGKRLCVLHDVYAQLAPEGVLMLGSQEENELSAHDKEMDRFFRCFRSSEMAISTQAA
jgi:chemotaxis protein methyltransferase CheR